MGLMEDTRTITKNGKTVTRHYQGVRVSLGDTEARRYVDKTLDTTEGWEDQKLYTYKYGWEITEPYEGGEGDGFPPVQIGDSMITDIPDSLLRAMSGIDKEISGF
jgi:hypothetical protein